MFCRNCGNHLDVNNKVCNKCGTNNNSRINNNSKGLKLFLNRFKQDSLFANKMLCKLFFLHEILIIITFICMSKEDVSDIISYKMTAFGGAFLSLYSFCRILPALIEHFISKRYLRNKKYKLLKLMYILSIISWIVSIEFFTMILCGLPIILNITLFILILVDTVLTLLLRLKMRQEKIIHQN